MDNVIVSLVNRIHMFVYDYHYLTLGENAELAGGAGLSIDTGLRMKVALTKEDNIVSQHASVLRFYVKRIKEIVSYNGGISLTVDKKMEAHTGYGSTICLISALFYAVNALFETPFSKDDILRYINSNYCEDNDGTLAKGFDTGVGPVCSFCGGINFIKSRNQHYHLNVSDKYSVLTFIPQLPQFEKNLSISYEHRRLSKLYDREEADWMEKSRYVDNLLIPHMESGDLQGFGQDVLKMHQVGSKRVECEEYDYDIQNEIINQLLSCGSCIAGLSSAGPSNFVVLKNDAIETVEHCIRQYCPSGSIRRFRISKEGLSIIS